jgi:hypothetical protein
MEAHNRILELWYGKIKRGEIKLPRFQRPEEWDWRRRCSLFNTVTENLPLGITLVLEVGENQPFVSRYLMTAPENNGRLLELLLDGQQRLTTLWRVMHNNYDDETYYVYLPEYDELNFQESERTIIFRRGRYYKKNGQKYPLWCDQPEECLKRGMVPTNLLKPEDVRNEIDQWIDEAASYRKPTNPEDFESFFNWKKNLSDRILELRSVIKNYNLPYLSLPPSTEKDTALEVFINMNTNSKPLSQYDIIVAEVESVKGQSLHNLVEGISKHYPDVIRYEDITRLILNASALLQEKLPNQKGAWDMDKVKMVEEWERMVAGLSRMARFMYNEGIIDRERLPTNAVLAVIAALYPYIPEKGDEMGKYELLLKKYLWSAFFTNRYENSAATNAFYDYLSLKRVITKTINPKTGQPFTEADVPIFNRDEYEIADADELISAGWPKRDTIRGKAVMAVACRFGSYDFATGQKVDKENIHSRHYHHIFPDALLKEADIDGFKALNCALIADSTNLNIGRKDPLKYLKERYDWVSEEIVKDRLNSHLIPVEELSNGGYEGIISDDEKVNKLKTDYEMFMRKRAQLVAYAAECLATGKQITATEIINFVSQEA